MRCAVGRSKIASVAPPSELTPPNLTMPTIRNRSTGPRVSTPIVSPTAKCFVVRGLRVDRDLVRRRSASAPAVSDERVEALVALRVDAEREVRRAAVRDHLAVAVDELRLVGDAALGDGDAGQAAHARRAATRAATAA